MSINLSATTPAAPGGNTNVTWQADGQGNISGFVPTAPVAPVTSVFTRTGAVTAQTGDYTAAQVGAISTSVMTTLGDTLYGGASGVATRLAGNTTTTRNFLRQTGAAGPVSAAPAWDTLVSGDIPNNAANTSGTAANLSGTPALPNGTTATTQTALSADTKIATDAYCDSAVGVEKTRALTAEVLLAPLASPALTGAPTAPTQAAGDNSTRLATTAYVDAPASGGTPIVNIPLGLGGILPCNAPGSTAVGTANVQEEIYFVCDEDFTINNVAIFLTTGVGSGLMDIAIYNATGTTKLTSTGAFSIGTAFNGTAVKTALSSSITLRKKTGYWIAWTLNTNSVSIDNTLMSGSFQAMYNATVVRSGSSGTATSGGVTNATIGTVASVLLRIPTMYFD